MQTILLDDTTQHRHKSHKVVLLASDNSDEEEENDTEVVEIPLILIEDDVMVVSYFCKPHFNDLLSITVIISFSTSNYVKHQQQRTIHTWVWR